MTCVLGTKKKNINKRRNEFFGFTSKQKGFTSFIMDVKINVNDIIASAEKAFHEGNYKPVIALLEPLLKGEKKKTLLPTQELNAIILLSSVFRFLGD